MNINLISVYLFLLLTHFSLLSLGVSSLQPKLKNNSTGIAASNWIKKSNKIEAENIELLKNGKFLSEFTNTVRDPRIYLAQLREKIKCQGPGCDEYYSGLMEKLIRSELYDFLALLKFGGSQYPKNHSIIYKVHGLRLLIMYLQSINLSRAAQTAENLLLAHHPEVCFGFKANEEFDSYNPECESDPAGPNCNIECMTDDMLSFINNLKQPNDREALLRAFTDADNILSKYFMSACEIINKTPQYDPENSMSVQVPKNTRPLCGILESSSVIMALSGSSGEFHGSAQTDTISEYSCLEVSLSIDNKAKVWRAKEPNKNYLIYDDGTVRNLNGEDFIAIQKAVKHFTNLIKLRPAKDRVNNK